jgi:DNA-binding transcriptional ArsR family regulator
MKEDRDPAELKGSAPVFAALGDATRLRLVARLSEGGPQSIKGLTRGSSRTRQAVTKHLRVLADAGLARGTRVGRESRWELEPGRLEVAYRYLELVSKRWDDALGRLQKFVEESPK